MIFSLGDQPKSTIVDVDVAEGWELVLKSKLQHYDPWQREAQAPPGAITGQTEGSKLS